MLNTSQSRSTNEIPNYVVIDNEYIIVKNIYKGNTYNLYIAVKRDCSDDQNKFVLIKMRRTNATEQNFELYFLNKLKDSKCTTKILSMGEQTIKEQLYHYQVMERHGPSLKLVYNFLSKNIPITILCLMAIQTLACLEQIHKQLIIHRNIRPKKLLISQSGSEILLTDFKHACRYRKQQKNIIVNDNLRSSSNKRFLNKFSSLNQHLEQVSSPKDDLESLALIIIYYGGFAPVLDIKEENKGLKIKKLEHAKLTLLPELSFKGAPLEFIQFYNGVKQSCVSDYPQDYEKYKQIFRKLLNTFGYSEKDIVYPHLSMIKQYHYNVNVIIEEQETQAQIDSIDEDQSVFRKIKELDGKRKLKTKLSERMIRINYQFMQYNLKDYFVILQANLKNIESWKRLMILIAFYQLCDAIIVAVEAIFENIEGEKFIMIYRILTQIFLMAFFHVLLIKLLKIKNRLINLITLLKCICVIICWEELDYNLQRTINQTMLEQFIIVLCFVFAIESQVCQTLAILFNLIYSLMRHFRFDSKINIQFAIRFTIMHVILQIYVIITSQKNNKSYSNAQLIAMSANNKINYSQMYTNRIMSPKQNQSQFGVELSDKRNQYGIQYDQKIEDDQTESIQQEHLYEVLLSSFDQGIYIIDNLSQQIQTVNPLFSNLILNNEKLNLKLFETQIADCGLNVEDNYLIIPKVNKSYDIDKFLKFSQTLDSNLLI